MKANSRKATAESTWQDICEVLEDNLILILQVLHEEYGFGDKRLSDVIEAVHAKAKQFNEWSREEVLDLKTQHDRRLHHNNIREMIKLEAEEFMTSDMYDYFFKVPLPTNQQVMAQCKAREKAYERKERISLAEAQKMQESLTALRNYQNSITGGNNHE